MRQREAYSSRRRYYNEASKSFAESKEILQWGSEKFSGVEGDITMRQRKASPSRRRYYNDAVKSLVESKEILQ
jgi:hypothetical protein